MRGALTISLVFLAVTGWTRAEEKPASRPVASEDAINAARRDLDLIKASRDRTAPPKGDGPRLSVPELQSPGASGPLSSQKSRTAEKEKDKKSKNWLVDAMDKKSDERNARGKSRSDDRRGKMEEEDLPGEPRAGREEFGARDARSEKYEKDEPERRPEPVANPLTQYAADWMTPQDFTLMRPVLEGFRAGELGQNASAGTASGLAAIPGLSAPAGVEAATGVFAAAKTFNPPTPQENPYLQSLNAPTASLPAWNPPTPPPSASAMSPMPVPIFAPSAPPVEKTKIPDFVKPANDEKYFKQLKRF